MFTANKINYIIDIYFNSNYYFLTYLYFKYSEIKNNIIKLLQPPSLL